MTDPRSVSAATVADIPTRAELAASVVVDLATAIATALGLGDDAQASEQWPVGAGDALVRVLLSGAVDGELVLATNADVARRLAASGTELLAAFEAARAAIEATVGDAVGAAAPEIEELDADASTRPMAVAEITDAGRLTSLLGCTFDRVAGLAEVQGGDGEGLTAGAFEPETFDRDAWQPQPATPRGPLSVLSGVEMIVTAELGRTTMPMRELLGLTPGMVVEIDRAAGSPIDLLVNGRRIASGEVVVIDEEFGIRITEISPTSEAS